MDGLILALYKRTEVEVSYATVLVIVLIILSVHLK